MSHNAKRWKQLASQLLIDDAPYLRLRQDHVALPSGAEMTNFYVCEYSDWVGIIAQTSEGNFVMVEQYRYGVDRLILEFPAGMINPSEAPMNAAKRELLEETGFVSDEWEHIGTWFTEPSRHTNQAHFFLARNAVLRQNIDLDDTEDLEVRILAPETVEANLQHAIHVAAYYKTKCGLLRKDS